VRGSAAAFTDVSTGAWYQRQPYNRGLVTHVVAPPGPDHISGESEGLIDRLDAAWVEWAPYVALAAAWTALVGSLYFSEWRGFTPCALCWYQRILMYPLAPILLVSILRRDQGVWTYVLPLSLLGAATSTYHILIERGIVETSNACRVGVSCRVLYINAFGFITIPTLALTAFLIIGLTMLAARRGVPEAGPVLTPAPWKGVAAVLLAVAAFFALVLTFGPPHS
jgi:disulfide bond formation protein DsbB